MASVDAATLCSESTMQCTCKEEMLSKMAAARACSVSFASSTAVARLKSSTQPLLRVAEAALRSPDSSSEPAGCGV